MLCACALLLGMSQMSPWINTGRPCLGTAWLRNAGDHDGLEKAHESCWLLSCSSQHDDISAMYVVLHFDEAGKHCDRAAQRLQDYCTAIAQLRPNSFSRWQGGCRHPRDLQSIGMSYAPVPAICLRLCVRDDVKSAAAARALCASSPMQGHYCAHGAAIQVAVT